MTKRVLAVLFLAASLAMAQKPEYASNGDLELPKDYREWVFLSSGYATAYDSANGSNANMLFHNVFVNPSAYRGFLKTGAWPDKTVLILELRNSAANVSAANVSMNKQGRVQTGIAAIEVHVKDSAKGGWLFYGFRGGEQKGSVFAKTADCYSCHQQNGATDTTFVQFYPTLIETAKQHGNFKAER